MNLKTIVIVSTCVLLILPFGSVVSHASENKLKIGCLDKEDLNNLITLPGSMMDNLNIKLDELINDCKKQENNG
ncbi:hypothetical protein ABE52_31525 [Bacillus thuringiensis]|uniref:Uncharacterized protein n=1 Tax=Bacillus thuringiensis YBT-1518 TaxID=529122 RepID=A0A9W3KJ27_BACTU|nr:hypothetical protein [Bacillus thuringiensis]AHA75518.1 hypothetical protein YBT1518_34206 [Bacillus thuringiensis YBT-1518]MBG9486515.1 hypothetical protein [Bacillus thuringiensis]